MPIPSFDPVTGYLPPGEHLATWTEIEQCLGGTYRRKVLLGNLKHVLVQLWERGVVTCWIDGSFATDTERPGDVDLVYLPPANVDLALWESLSPANSKRLKHLYKIHLFPFPSPQHPPTQPFQTITILEFFGHDRDAQPKGLVRFEGDWL